MHREQRGKWDTIWAAEFWALWRERNRRHFTNKRQVVQVLIYETTRHTYLVNRRLDDREAKPIVPVATSSEKEQTAHARWMRSNRLCLWVMQKTIHESFRGPVSDSTLAKDYLKEIEQRFVRFENVEIDILLNKLCTMKYSGKSNVRKQILEMMHIASKLKGHKIDISDDMLVYLAFNSLPVSLGQFKVSYYCQKDSWTVNELISHCVQEEKRLRSDKSESTNIAYTSKSKGK
ncbi:uncharacterized protein LOC144564457 [Carex rostrata]